MKIFFMEEERRPSSTPDDLGTWPNARFSHKHEVISMRDEARGAAGKIRGFRRKILKKRSGKKRRLEQTGRETTSVGTCLYTAMTVKIVMVYPHILILAILQKFTQVNALYTLFRPVRTQTLNRNSDIKG
ncbi:hypothetical protein TcasGA2_TC012404 [Tribolium castaneum]|uniref:Uncharacterized protein n=1 Tax=Tribolium castaneum TaxID=7070 RepID=D6X239_TRICA|nr:hypothetical protein TcasGA2_TC012404 [Tribolium castaneum]